MTRRYRSRVRNRGRIPRSYYLLPFQDTFVDVKEDEVPPVKHDQGGTGNRKRTRDEIEQHWQDLRNRTKSLRQKTGHIISETGSHAAHFLKRHLAQEVEAALVSGVVGGLLALAPETGGASVLAAEEIEMIPISSAMGARYGSLLL